MLPSLLKKPLYRLLFGYRFGPGLLIGLSLLDAQVVAVGAGTRIEDLNAILRVRQLRAGRHTRVGTLNIMRGGERVNLVACNRQSGTVDPV
jgi:hypothetical protein